MPLSLPHPWSGDSQGLQCPLCQTFEHYLYNYFFCSYICLLFDQDTVSGNNFKLTDKSDTSHYCQSCG